MSKNLYIRKHSNSALVLEEQELINKGEYVFTGTFGVLDITNENGRVYTKDQYLPQIKMLQEKIKKSKLLGELDHPKNFDISLKNASHVIEDLYYDEASNSIKGKIRLLNTAAGRDAKAIVDAGVPLHISSRAAGKVGEGGKVMFERLFTYDLVATPGFKEAELERVMEGREAFRYSLITESLGYEDDSLEIFEVDWNIPTGANDLLDDKYNVNENKDSYPMEDVVKRGDFLSYSKHIKEQMTSMRDELKALRESSSGTANSSDTKLEGYVRKMADKMNEMYAYLNHVVENYNESVHTINAIKEHNNLIVSRVRDIKEYLDENNMHMNGMVKFGEENARITNEALDDLSTKIDNLVRFGNHLSEGVNKVATYSSVYLRENIETVGQYADNNSKHIQGIKESVGITQKQETSVTESKNNVTTYKEQIAGKLDLLIESAQKQTAGLDKDLHFLRFLQTEDVERYNNLNESQKALIIEKAKVAQYTSEGEVKAIMESVISPANTEPLYIKYMPEEYKEAWQNASPEKKHRIITESQAYSLTNQAEIDYFWNGRDFRESSNGIQRINESATVNENVETPLYGGVTQEYLDAFGKQLANRFLKY